MASQADGLLVHADLVRVDHYLGGDPALVNSRACAGAYVTKKITADSFNTYVSFTVTSNDLKNCVTRTITFKDYTTGIKNLETITLPNGVKAIYNMAGQQVTSMQSGQVYIVKYTNGESKKMIKK